jgi:hypothetical protein
MLNEDSIKQVIKFMPESQARCFLDGLMGSEQRYYLGIAEKINFVIKIHSYLKKHRNGVM